MLGWIDQDPTANHHPYYKAMCAKPVSDKLGLMYCYNNKRNNKLIIVKPKLEDWIIGIAHSKGINLEDYELSNDPDELHKLINFRISKFQELLHKLIKLRSPALLNAIKILNDKRLNDI